MPNPITWTWERILGLFERAVAFAKSIRRLMTLLALVIGACFIFLWRVTVFHPPNGCDDLEIYLWHDIVVIVILALIITACCILAFLWSKERLKADPDYLSKPSENE